MSPALKKALVWIVKIGVSAGLLWILFSRVDFARLWEQARRASPLWLAGSIGLYFVTVMIGVWRWRLLLSAVPVPVATRTLMSSYLVATFFNNFLPSNIGGDFIRIADTARPARSKTVATLIVLIDRGVGLLGLVLVAALGASFADHLPGTGVIGPSILWSIFAGGLIVAAALITHPTLLMRLLGPARRLHVEWVGERLRKLDLLLTRLRATPSALLGCLFGAVLVQTALVGFYLAIARSLAIPISTSQLAVIVPMTFLVQLLPMSLNGFGVREATWAYYFTSIGLSIEQALLMSFMGAAMIMVFSLSGAVAYVARGKQPVDIRELSP